ncbi:hypothetical protein AVW11_28760 [Streptomyces amritsarensis]|uniref:Uncharacterized protein n=1 Tax=Streptomyces amritsarensis TaxID=681158 RepID=A0ABX3FYT1_9ACTN|nr:hypothetical protein [Streptomyces amritsarensis]OLZ57957.1 hypothetical protein AVW11_28760 [Streptomyces amritsarensis]
MPRPSPPSCCPPRCRTARTGRRPRRCRRRARTGVRRPGPRRAGTSSGTSTAGGSGKHTPDDRSGPGDSEGSRDNLGTGELGKDRQRELDSRLKADLCEEYRKGRLDDDRRERLSRLADGLLRIPAYCASVLEGDSGGTTRRDSPLGGGGTLRAPSLTPAVPEGSAPLRAGR